MNTLSHLDRMLDPVTQMMPVEFAQKLVDFRADESVQQRIDYLRNRANQGTLTPEEDSEYKDVIEAIDLISLLQAKARRVLSRHSS